MPEDTEQPAAPKHPGGRPSKLSKEITDKAIEAAKLNVSDATLCRYCRIHPETLINWRHKARIGDKKFVEFFAKIDEARAEGTISSMKEIKAAKDWRAHAYLVDRAEGRASQPIQLTGKDDGPVKVDTGIMPPVYLILQGAEGLHNPYEPPPPSQVEPGQ